MSNWVFVVTGRKFEGKMIPPEQILGMRFEDKFWGLGENTPNRRNLQEGDSVVFYMGLPRKEFVASAGLASDSFELSREESKRFSHASDFYWNEHGVLLKDTQVWSNPTKAEMIVPELQFIENKEYWYSYFQGGIRQIDDHDFALIVHARELALEEKLDAQEDLASASEFALEAHLEEFLDSNWSQIDFGRKLALHADAEQSGRQYPAGPWSIDFLCVDRDTDDLVVIELKRGKTSDATVGQVLRYMGWVRENIARRGQDVHGIIIAREFDQGLKYAMAGQEKLRVLTYKVDFELRDQTTAR